MIICDCCGRQIFDGEGITHRSIPGTQSKIDPYGHLQDWCAGCNEDRFNIENDVRNFYRKEQMKELDARIKALIAFKRGRKMDESFDKHTNNFNFESSGGSKRKSTRENEAES